MRFAAGAVASHDGAEAALLAFQGDDIHAGMDRELRIGTNAVLEDRRGREIRTCEDPHGVCKLGQMEPLLEGRVPSTDHHDFIGSLVERSVAGGAEVHATADQLVLAGNVETTILRPGRDDHGRRAELLARR